MRSDGWKFRLWQAEEQAPITASAFQSGTDASARYSVIWPTRRATSVQSILLHSSDTIIVLTSSFRLLDEMYNRSIKFNRYLPIYFYHVAVTSAFQPLDALAKVLPFNQTRLFGNNYDFYFIQIRANFQTMFWNSIDVFHLLWLSWSTCDVARVLGWKLSPVVFYH